jgi:hypothetical protein
VRARENPDFSQPPSYWQSEAKNYRAPSQLYSDDGGAHTGTEEQVLASEVPKISWIPLTLSV